MQILFLTQVLPYPLDTGAKVRAYYVLRHLARQHAVTLVSFVRPTDQPAHLDHLRTFCQAVHPVPLVRSRRRDAAALAAAIRQHEPVLIARDRVSAMTTQLSRLVDAGPFDAVHADQTAMVQYALASAQRILHVHGRRPLTVLDAHNALYQVVAQLAQEAPHPLTRRFLAWEARRLARYEQDTYSRFDQVVFVTAQDRTRLGLAQAAVIPICTDPAATPPVMHSAGARRVTFVGTLLWPPNALGVTWFAREVWPAVHAAEPTAQLTIIGAAPPPAVAALERELPNVTVTGYVSDLRAYLAETAVFLAPLQAGGGMRVKIVEAWTWELPVVSTTIGAEGLDGEDGGNLLIADDAAGQAAAVVRLLRNRELASRLAQAGRRTAEATYSWESVYRSWDAVYAPPPLVQRVEPEQTWWMHA